MDESRPLRAGLYLRVSTFSQECENQKAQLLEYCERQGWEIVDTYTDAGLSGADSDRPELSRLFEDARRRKFDAVVFWSLDRFSRSGVLDTIIKLNELKSYGVEFESFQERYLSSLGPFKDAIIGLLAALARQERVRLSERVRAGLRRARAEGKKLGRPPTEVDINRVVRLKQDGMSLRKIAGVMGVSKTKIWGVLKTLKNRGATGQ